MGWGDYAKTAKDASGGGGDVIRLPKAGDRVKLVLVGSPWWKWTAKRGKGNTKENFHDVEPGYVQKPGDEDVFVKFGIQAVDVQKGEAKIVEMTNGLFQQVAGLFDRFDGDQDRVIMITREGSGRDTKWTVDNIDRVNDEQRRMMDEELGANHDLMEEKLAKFGFARMPSEPLPAKSSSGDVPNPDYASGADDDAPF